jgi:heat shock protein HslJ
MTAAPAGPRFPRPATRQTGTRNPATPGTRPTRMKFLAPALLMTILTGTLTACAYTPAGSGTSGGWPAGRTFTSSSLTGHTLVAGTRITLTFHPGNTVTAHAGCNQLTAPGRLSDGKLIAGPIRQTLLGCDPGRVQQDQWLASFLTAKPRWHLAGDQLQLTSGTIRLTLTA